MNSDVVYGKTPKGVAEMTQRTYKLPARMRALLIMIDGKTPVAELIRRTPSPDEAASHFASLLENGFIAGKDTGAAGAAIADAPPAALDRLEKARKFMVTSMLAALGPDADLFTGKIEAARSMSALSELALKYLEVVRSGGGGKKADAFRAGLLAHGVITDAQDSKPLPPAA